jgi:hypothetical protein
MDRAYSPVCPSAIASVIEDLLVLHCTAAGRPLVLACV